MSNVRQHLLDGPCVQTVLQSEQDMGALLGTNQNFERWIKHGFSTEDLLNSSNDSEEVLSQGSLSLQPYLALSIVALPRLCP